MLQERTRIEAKCFVEVVNDTDESDSDGDTTTFAKQEIEWCKAVITEAYRTTTGAINYEVEFEEDGTRQRGYPPKDIRLINQKNTTPSTLRTYRTGKLVLHGDVNIPSMADPGKTPDPALERRLVEQFNKTSNSYSIFQPDEENMKKAMDIISDSDDDDIPLSMLKHGR